MHVAVIGAGVTGVTTAYSLLQRGYDVTILERHSYPAMETSYANGGQLSACNAEVWNSTSTVLKGMKWMLDKSAPLLLNARPSWHKYSWIGEFIAAIPKYRANTIEPVRLAIAARERMFSIAEREGIEFDLERRGILHIYKTADEFRVAERVNELLKAGGLDRRPVTPEEIRSIEPTLAGNFFGGFYTPSDSTGDIHKFTKGLARACIRLGATFLTDVNVRDIALTDYSAVLHWSSTSEVDSPRQTREFDAVVVCGGVGSRQLAKLLGDRVNIYPVKGYSVTVQLNDEISQSSAPWVSLLDDAAKIVTSRLGADRFRVAGTAEINGMNRDIRADRIEPLVRWIRCNFPLVDTSAVIPWSGLRPMMPNMLPRVGAGRNPKVFYNTGHGHLGWTLSCATAELVAVSIMQSLPPRHPAAA